MYNLKKIIVIIKNYKIKVNQKIIKINLVFYFILSSVLQIMVSTMKQ